MDRIQRLAIMACGVALALAGSSALAQQTPKYTNAEVVKVRTQERLLVIKNADGVEQTLELDDHVVGIGELRPGDRVILTLRGEAGRSRVESFSKSEASQKSAASQTRAVAQQRPSAVVEDTGEETRAGSAFEARVAALAQQSVRVDGLWSSFRTSCNVLLRGRRRLRRRAALAQPVGRRGAGGPVERQLPRHVQPDREPRPGGERGDGRCRGRGGTRALSGADPRDRAASLARVGGMGTGRAGAAGPPLAAHPRRRSREP